MNTTAKIVCLSLCFLSSVYESLIQASSSKLNVDVIQNNVSSNAATPYEYDLEIDGIYYKITSIDNLELKVVGGKNVYSGDIVIPDEIDYRGKKFQITEIDDKCFYKSAVTTVQLGNNISLIGRYAFYGSTIREIVIPASVTKLYEYSFDYCQSLTKLIFSDGTDELYVFGETSSFENCPIEYLHIGRNIRSPYFFEKAFFGDLSKATEIKIGPTVTKLEGYLLYGASKITSLTIPQSVKTIGYQTFDNCISLKSVIFEDGEGSVRCNTMFYDSPIEYVYIGRNINEDDLSGIISSNTPVKKLEIGPMVTTLTSLRNLRELTEIKLQKNIKKTRWLN